jgi:hypothetical protein
MSHPWKEISLNDYENHMRLENVYQLQTMNEMMKEQFCAYPAQSVMILGVAGGNGLEHIDPQKFHSVYGVDINPDYLAVCQKRYPDLSDCFQPICADLSDDALHLPHADLLIANLLIEYIGYTRFQTVVTKVKPQYLSCIIQVNTETSFVSESPYLHALDRLDEIHHLIGEQELTNRMQEIGYMKELTAVKDLPNGKKFVRLDFAG